LLFSTLQKSPRKSTENVKVASKTEPKVTNKGKVQSTKPSNKQPPPTKTNAYTTDDDDDKDFNKQVCGSIIAD